MGGSRAARRVTPRLAVIGMLKSLFICALTAILIGYAFLGKGFAYLHLPLGAPVFVGELVLVLGLIAALANPGIAARALRVPAVKLYAVFFVLGVFHTIPYLASFGVTAVRDAALYYYGIFMVLVAGLVVTPRDVAAVVGLCARVAPVFLIWIPFATYASTFLADSLPLTPGTEVPAILVKPGDAAILTGVALTITLVMPDFCWLTRWPTAAMILCAVALAPTLYSRAAALGLLLALGLTAALTRSRRLLRFGVVSAFLLLMALACRTSIRLPDRGRELSVRGVWDGLASLVGEKGRGVAAEEYEGTKNWRVEWWSKIVGETILGRYFLRGRGFGENLAVAHEIEGFEEEEGSLPLRSPHNSHLTILSRMGVPGAILWVVLNAMIVRALWVSRRRAQRRGDSFTEGVTVVLLGYWVMFTVVSATDVSLEGPHGGIWFWSVAGFALALRGMEGERAGPPEEPEESSRVEPT